MLANKSYQYGVLEFTSKSRVNGTGITFIPVYAHDKKKRIVHSKKEYQKDMWAKVGNDGLLMEILGPTGSPGLESVVLREQYGITPCKYPKNITISNSGICDLHSNKSKYDAITVDGPDTQDFDDAISIQNIGNGKVEVAIHITNVTRLGPYSTVLEWARERGASAYFFDGGKTPMLPPSIAHGVLSLRAGNIHPCLSVIMIYDIDTRACEHISWGYTNVHITQNVTYDDFSIKDDFVYIRETLQMLSGCHDSEDLIAWAMVQYNLFFADWATKSIHAHAMIIRAQDKIDGHAVYINASSQKKHASMGGLVYGHFTSPIRRFADMHNQYILSGLVSKALDETELEALNARMTCIQQFHAKDVVISLADIYRDSPRILQARIVATDDGKALRVWLPEYTRNVTVPIHDSFFAEPIADALILQDNHTIELFGIIKNHTAQLRIRLVNLATTFDNNDVPNIAIEKAYDTQTLSSTTPLICTDLHSATERIQTLAGYQLDDFQKRALEVIINGHDLLGMAPTGSGKTILALMAIVLRAFDIGSRAILTSPIKALSNQKFAEFSCWFNRMGMSKRVTLLTGDIQARAAEPGGDGKPELIIMTSEILANKLDAMNRTGQVDPDLVNVKTIVMDEVHYINDPDRGGVWERSLMLTPQDIQIVALSATLDAPDRFCDWLNKRRPSKVIQRFDRHVPLYFGCYDNRGNFVELHCTHNIDRGFSSATYDSVINNKTHNKDLNLNQSVNNLISTLERNDKLPAIVFFLSREKCVAAAQSITRNLLLGPCPKRDKDQDDYAWEWIMEQHQEHVQNIRNKQDELFRKHLVPYKNILEKLPGFFDFMNMLDRGIGYHHAGMIPIMREYVELLFQQRLIRVVFATETLGVGINMPARTVVFTQLEKPTGKDGSYRMLRPDEFWQMAGRSGRRGMDDKGFVVYSPMGHRGSCTAHEIQQLLYGKVPRATSQLRVDPMFVLKHFHQGATPEAMLCKTFLNHSYQQQLATMQDKLSKLPHLSPDELSDIQVYNEKQLKLNQNVGFIKLTPKQRKAYESDIRAILKRFGDDKTKLQALSNLWSERLDTEKEISALTSALDDEWNHSLSWLTNHGFIDCITNDENNDGILSHKMTLIGRTAVTLNDALPLIRAIVLCSGSLDTLSFNDFACWLASFSEQLPINHDARGYLPKPSPYLEQCLYESQDLTFDILNSFSGFYLETAGLVQVWLESNKDLCAIANFLDPHQLGVFVKVILRTLSLIEEMKPAILGLEKYELYNKLQYAHDTLLSGIVTNKSLYVA